jgi:hypothetical protein
MRSLRTTSAIGMLAAGALLVAACGGNAATPAPSAAATTGPATAAPATQAAPTEVPGATDAFPSFAVPSIHGDTDLESLVPKQLGGETLIVLSMTGDQFLGQGSASPELADALKALGKTTSDLSVAFGGTSAISVIAFRVKGVPADALFNAFKAAQTDQFTSESVSYGGKTETKITPSAGDNGIAFIYVKDDTMFVIGSAATSAPVPSDALLNEAFSKLP